MPARKPNAELRTREWLTPDEMVRLLKAASKNRNGKRDWLMILMAYRHGLRASELCDLEWSQIDFKAQTLNVRRAKGGTTSNHPILGDELRALRALRNEAGNAAAIFVSEHDAPFSPRGFNRLVARAGEKAKLGFPIHSHMIRHSTGYKLANDGHDTRSLQAYLGHKNIQHTVRYTELSPTRFKNFWR